MGRGGEADSWGGGGRALILTTKRSVGIFVQSSRASTGLWQNESGLSFNLEEFFYGDSHDHLHENCRHLRPIMGLPQGCLLVKRCALLVIHNESYGTTIPQK